MKEIVKRKYNMVKQNKTDTGRTIGCSNKSGGTYSSAKQLKINE